MRLTWGGVSFAALRRLTPGYDVDAPSGHLFAMRRRWRLMPTVKQTFVADGGVGVPWIEQHASGAPPPSAEMRLRKTPVADMGVDVLGDARKVVQIAELNLRSKGAVSRKEVALHLER